jgi:NAD(P)H-hydrate epimerase
MPGAAILCGEAALRSGAGRVSVATDPDHVMTLVNERPELMARGIESSADLADALQRSDVIAVGPGLGQTDWAKDLMNAVDAFTGLAVWDADALNWLAAHPAQTEQRIITPHPGEAATLLGTTTSEIQADRRAAVTALQHRYGGVVVLKGAGTLVKGADSLIRVSSSGNPGMASPGMGDVLAGIIAALLAQGLGLLDAATAGVELHAQVGDLAARKGERGLLASDLLQELRSVVNR